MGKLQKKNLSRPIFDLGILPGLRRPNDLEILYLSHKTFINKQCKFWLTDRDCALIGD